MEILHIEDQRVSQVLLTDAQPTKRGFYWITSCATDVLANRDQWVAQIKHLAGVQIDELHLIDATNALHPSYYDNTSAYEMVVFRKLMVDLSTDRQNQKQTEGSTTPAPSASFQPPSPNGTDAVTHTDKRPGGIPALANLSTAPVTFFLTERALIVVHPPQSRTTQELWKRLMDQCIVHDSATNDADGAPVASVAPRAHFRAPANPAELMLRLLNGMVDRYLDLRTPMQRQLDTWQRELLDPRRPFNNWVSLLDARQSLRSLEALCEEQYDALQEFRDAMIERSGNLRLDDSQLVRVNDVMEHVARVLSHTRRLEDGIESTVQIHFSALTHRTGEIMRVLTVLTAVFMPLTLITGIFGMNFKNMPLLDNPLGFTMTMLGMGVLAIVLITFFATKRYLSSRPSTKSE